jgi:CheY-like chemotaxis protein
MSDQAGRSVVLYIEDNVSNLKLIERVLAQRPAVTLLSEMAGRPGLDTARARRPDLVLLDLHLPDISGEEVLHLLRASPETQEIPVVVISADATPKQIERLLGAGARAYLTKPVDVRRLLALLDETLAPAGTG